MSLAWAGTSKRELSRYPYGGGAQKAAAETWGGPSPTPRQRLKAPVANGRRELYSDAKCQQRRDGVVRTGYL